MNERLKNLPYDDTLFPAELKALPTNEAHDIWRYFPDYDIMEEYAPCIYARVNYEPEADDGVQIVCYVVEIDLVYEGYTTNIEEIECLVERLINEINS